jgi:hypothetical protein
MFTILASIQLVLNILCTLCYLLGLHFITNMNQILSPHQVELYTSLNELPILDETNHHLVSPQHITIFLQLIP